MTTPARRRGYSQASTSPADPPPTHQWSASESGLADVKRGSQARKRAAVERTAPFVGFIYTTLVLWFSDGAWESPLAAPPRRPWYRQKQGLCFADVLHCAQQIMPALDVLDPHRTLDELRKNARSCRQPQIVEHPLAAYGRSPSQSTHMPLAVYHFFLNGGRRTYVVRLLAANATVDPRSFAASTLAGSSIQRSLRGASPGAPRRHAANLAANAFVPGLMASTVTGSARNHVNPRQAATMSEEQPKVESCVSESPAWAEKLPESQRKVFEAQHKLSCQNATQKRKAADNKATDAYNAAAATREKAQIQAELDTVEAAANLETAVQAAELKYRKSMGAIDKPCGDSTSPVTEGKKAMFAALRDHEKRQAGMANAIELARITSSEAQAAAALATAVVTKDLATTTASETEAAEHKGAIHTFYKALHDELEKLSSDS